MAILNNGATKGGAAGVFAMLHGLSAVDTWQLHRSQNPEAVNFAEERIANLDETTGHWIMLSANTDGSFAEVRRTTTNISAPAPTSLANRMCKP